MSEKGFIKKETMQGIADAVKEKTGLSEIAVPDIEEKIRSITGDDGSADLANEAMQTETARLEARLGGDESESVYDSVYGSGYEKGIEDGVKSEYDEFWDAYQDYGKRTKYQFAFAGFGWTEENFKPKYDIKPTSVKNLFAYGGLIGRDIAETLNTLGIVFDTSNVTSTDGFMGFCEYSGPKRFPVISTVNCPRIIEMFYYADYLETIDKLILKDDGSQLYRSAFMGCKNLKNIIIEGTIGGNDFSVKDSLLLSKVSITSIVNALSSTTTGLTVTLSLTAVNNAFETSEGAADGSTSQEWLDLVSTKSNWTISLA